MGDKIKYSSGYKYQLRETYLIKIDIHPEYDIYTSFITLTKEGWLRITAGYAFDGPSGPTFDTPSFMRGSLVHDCGYQLIREGFLGLEYREYFDQLLQQICIEDGMWRIRAWWVYWGVRLGAGPCVLPSSVKPILEAP